MNYQLWQNYREKSEMKKEQGKQKHEFKKNCQKKRKKRKEKETKSKHTPTDIACCISAHFAMTIRSSRDPSTASSSVRSISKTGPP